MITLRRLKMSGEVADGPLKGEPSEDGESHHLGNLEDGELDLLSEDGGQSIKGAHDHPGDKAPSGGQGGLFLEFERCW